MRIKHPRSHEMAHLRYIRQLPCVVCLNDIQTEAAHIRFGDMRAGKRYTGMGEKPDDKWTLPLCNAHHAEQHRVGEDHFWRKHGIDPLRTAAFLHMHTGDVECGEQVCRHAKRQ